MAAVGKHVGSRTYAHVTLIDATDADFRAAVSRAVELARLRPESDFNIARFDRERCEVALLRYPTFMDELFPPLYASWAVHLPSGAVRFRDYSESLNPPILHRKELMIPATHPAWEQFSAQTRIAEEIGLFADPTRIGFRSQWQALLTEKGYVVVEGQLHPIGNAEALTASEAPSIEQLDGVARHLTALNRRFLSAPVQALLRTGVLGQPGSFFDYGCGKGDDVAGLSSLGFSASGWDPYFAPERPVLAADVVNLGFVINVIEDLEERIKALQKAFALARRALSVAAMLTSNASFRGRRYRDGILTSRNTFQKYYDQRELQNFIEAVLDEQAIPAGPGIFFVFRDPELEQQFLLRRQTDSTRAPRLLAVRKAERVESKASAARGSVDDSPERLRLMGFIWTRALELGRMPEEDECAERAEIVSCFGSWRKCLKATLARADSAELERAAAARREELQVVFALEAFGRKQHFRSFGPLMQRDIKQHFGSLLVAQLEGRRLLKECADVHVIQAAASKAAESGLGYLDGDHSLQLHSSLAQRLPAVLKAYLGCATTLYGDVSGADLLKIHIGSGKISLMRYDDFGSLLPRMTERVKVRLRDQDFDVFEYGGEYPAPFLYSKSRYINEEFPGFAAQLAFDQALERLGVRLDEGFGPAPDELLQWLRARRLEVTATGLTPASSIPDLDEKCGSYLTFRQLCECGETWETLKPRNVPATAETYNALHALARQVLDPAIEYFGAIKLTYGFASPALTRHICRAIAPRLDQHASCETHGSGRLICERRGAAVDFIVEFESMREVAAWIVDNCEFDRLYYYGDSRPIHVSVGPESSREVFQIVDRGGRRLPKRVTEIRAIAD